MTSFGWLRSQYFNPRHINKGVTDWQSMNGPESQNKKVDFGNLNLTYLIIENHAPMVFRSVTDDVGHSTKNCSEYRKIEFEQKLLNIQSCLYSWTRFSVEQFSQFKQFSNENWTQNSFWALFSPFWVYFSVHFSLFTYQLELN